MRLKIQLSSIFFFISILTFAQSDKIKVPVAGNYFAADIKNPQKDFKVYVRFAKTGKVEISLNTKEIVKAGFFEIKIKNQSKSIAFKNRKLIKTGEWVITDTGYVAIEFKFSKKDLTFAVEELELSGTAVNGKTTYVKNNEGNFYYWGRRGPSVHLNYQMPENIEAEWFYNEVTVPIGEDVIGSYFMANGFGEGYFGIQVNSATERRVLFSVWSPFTTDDPKSIPESHKIKMLKKGDDVYTGEFGNEGSGGQSYLKYNWKAGNTYRFLLHGTPSADSTTTYTAYFFAPELNEWKLVASFKRPKTQTYLKKMHSFLENFIPEMGDKQREVLFNNQWICDSKGSWTELNTARFTTDNTGNKGYRMDFAGGLNGSSFYLKNCGFFNSYTLPKTIFTRPLTNKKPEIDFNKLK